MTRRVTAPVLGLAVLATFLVLGLATMRRPGPDPPARRPTSPTRTRSGGAASSSSRVASTCHGVDARGTDVAPDLHGVGAASADFQLSTGRMPDTDPDRQPESKPPAYSKRRDRRPRRLHRVARRRTADPRTCTNHRATCRRARSLYLQICAACHSAAGNGGALSLGQRRAHAARRHRACRSRRRSAPARPNMPVFGPDTLTDQQVNSIVRYVEYLRDPDHPGGRAARARRTHHRGLRRHPHRARRAHAGHPLDRAPLDAGGTGRGRSRMTDEARRAARRPNRIALAFGITTLAAVGLAVTYAARRAVAGRGRAPRDRARRARVRVRRGRQAPAAAGPLRRGARPPRRDPRGAGVVRAGVRTGRAVAVRGAASW